MVCVNREEASLKEDSNRSSPTKAPGDQICNLLSTLLGSSAPVAVGSPASSKSSSSLAQDSPTPILDNNVMGEQSIGNVSPSRRDSPRLSSPGGSRNYFEAIRYTY